VGSLSLRPGDSHAIPWMALSVGSIRFVPSTDATQATKLPTLALMGLTPIEHVTFPWIHCSANNPGVSSECFYPDLYQAFFLRWAEVQVAALSN